ncbi:MAG: metal-dependent hydrolase [Kangiellaceae bacterium]|jgi:inner membrane protein|nr:metal-dependent hydrolase [Kangiellaceae bacterium]
MDSVTQVVLGAAVGEAVAGKSFGRKAAGWGAVLGTLPDLDVFVSYGDVVADFTYHRSATHSLIVMLLVTPAFAWLLNRIHAKRIVVKSAVVEPTGIKSTAVNNDRQFLRWCCLVFLCLSTHALLDSFTVYGTQLFWPLTEYPITWSTVFIIDPLYTLPLLVGVLVTLWHRSRIADNKNTKANTLGLVVSCCYLCWTVAVKFYIEHKVDNYMPISASSSAEVLTTPAPFNTLLWRVMIIDDEYYYDAFVSIFDEPVEPGYQRYQRRPELLSTLTNSWHVERLKWFTKGFYKVAEQDQSIIVSDIRMGLEPNYAFNFVVAERINDLIEAKPPERIILPRDISLATKIWQRIWDESVIVQ